MTIKLITKGGSGDFVTRFMGSGSASIGASGDVITLTPPSGQRVRLTHLSNEVGVNETVMSIFLGALDVTGSVAINGADPTGSGVVSIGSYAAYLQAQPPSGNVRYITGKVDEVLTVKKNSGTLVGTLYYGYEFGE